jgi:phosphatidylserine/phosphatidylglycerophosphate/cardiolipin synthase-like enzyme
MDVVIGSDVGERLLSLVAGAKRRLVIVSPWLSPAYADLAVKKQEEGTDVTVVTTNDPSNRTHQQALSRLIRRKRQKATPRQYLVLCIGVALMLGGTLYTFSVPFSSTSLIAGLISVVAGIILCAAGSRTRTYLCSAVGTLLVYTQPEPMLHAKIYIADDEVAVSSANFTVSGLRHNLECATFLSGKNVADDVIQRITELVSGRAVALQREHD